MKELNFSIKEFEQVQNDLFWEQLRQISFFYPKANIHVISDQSIDAPQVTLHKTNIAHNHTSKFLVYGLIDEPAMYLDCDILMLSKFKKKHLETKFPFRLYGCRTKQLSKLSKKPLPNYFNQYDASCIWIAEPSPSITNEINRLHDQYFFDEEHIASQGYWPHNDEYALSLFLHNNKYKMPYRDNVSICYKLAEKLSSAQSVHYGGIDIKGKIKCLQMMRKMRIKFL